MPASFTPTISAKQDPFPHPVLLNLLHTTNTDWRGKLKDRSREGIYELKKNPFCFIVFDGIASILCVVNRESMIERSVGIILCQQSVKI